MARRTAREATEVTPAAVEIVNEMLDQELPEGDEFAEQVFATQEAARNTAAEIIPVDVSENTLVNHTLRSLAGVLERGAAQTIDAQYAPGSLRPVQRSAMVMVQAFRDISSLDLAAVLLRVHYLNAIQQGNLLTVHPGEYSSLAQMASLNGCSVTEMTTSLDLVNIVFPYLRNELNLSIGEVWATLGKSMLKEMLPVLKSLITNRDADAATTKAAVERFFQEALDGMAADPNWLPVIQQAEDPRTPEPERQEAQREVQREARRRAARHLVELGGHLPVAEMRQHLRPEPTPPIEFMQVTQTDGSVLLVANPTPDQLAVLRHRMDHRAQIQPLDLPEDPAARQAEAFRIRPLRRLFELLGGRR